MRREIGFFTLAALILAFVYQAEAQQPGKVPRIGVLVNSSRSAFASRVEAFKQGLRDLGYVEGRNVVIDYRYSEAKMERLPDLAAEVLRLKPDVVVTHSAQAVVALKRATTSVPIVMNTGDPVAQGLVASLARPGGNITGLSYFLPEISAKGFELLRETVPSITRVAFLSDSTDPSYGLILKELRPTARALGVELQLVEAREANDIDNAFAVMTRKGAGGLQVMAHPVFVTHRTQIAKLAADNRLPTTFSQSEYVDAGGLMSYGVNLDDLWRRAATYVDKILKGTKPADLPVEQPKKFEFVINLKAAKQIGLTIPPNVLARADRVIK